MKTKERLIVLLCLLTMSVAGAAGALSYKALIALNRFDAFLIDMKRVLQADTKKEPLVPENY